MSDTPQTPALGRQIDGSGLPATNVEEVSQNYAAFVSLTANQKSVLLAMCEDFMSENIRTDAQIAIDCGITRKSVYNCKVNLDFTTALSVIMPELVKAKLPKYLAQIEKHGEKDYRPLEFLIKYAGLYVDKHQNMNINANIGTVGGANKPFAASVTDMLIRMGELGWTSDRVAELTVEFDKLKDEGAF